MRRPSMFSSTYRKQVRQRRINVTLMILILVSIGYYGAKYYCNKNDIKLINNISISKYIPNIKFPKISLGNKVDKNKDKKKDNTPKEQPNDNAQNVNKEEETKFFEYKANDNTSIKILYTLKNGEVELVGLPKGTDAFFDVSADKKFIVFEDKVSMSIVSCNQLGEFKSIEKKSYTAKSSEVILKKNNILKKYPDYKWAVKPMLLKDGKLVYLSHLPFVKKVNPLYVWVTDINGSFYKYLGPLTTDDLTKITFTHLEDGSIKILSEDKTYTINPDKLTISK